MSIGIVIKGPEGLVLAAESRITLAAQRREGQTIPVSFDNAWKVLKFASPNSFVGVVTYGLGGIGLRSAYSFVPEFESGLPENRLTVADFAQKFSDFFLQQWQSTMPSDYSGPPMTFVVAGFNETEPYGRVYLTVIPNAPNPVEQHSGPGQFGITWGGQREMVDRLLRGYDERTIHIARNTLHLEETQINQLREALRPLQMQIPIQFLPLQDCIDLAIFFVRTTIEAQKLTVGVRGCGGPIDIATITRLEGLKFVQEKHIHGESLAT